MASHILGRREQPRPLLRAAVEADALKRGASLEDLSRLQGELTRGAPVLERLIGGGARPRGLEGDAEEGPRASAQASKALESAHGSLRCSLEPSDRGPRGREGRDEPLGRDGCAPREARSPAAAPLSHERHCNAGPDREKTLRGGGAARQQENRQAAAGLDGSQEPALERVDKARKELEEASKKLLTSLNLQGNTKQASLARPIILYLYRKQFIRLKITP